ncbi:hypothetical protein [Pontibacter oryzae]|nr:hypothetical protein [Pontibacter oryzae]
MNEVIYEAGISSQQQQAAVELYSAAYLKIEYCASYKTLLVNWSGKTSSKELRNGYNLIREALMDYKPQKWLLDIHKRHPISKEDQQWVFKEVFPEILRRIDRDLFVAVVLPVTQFHALVGGLNGDEFIHDNSFLILQHFLYQEEAQRWLNQMHDFKLAASTRVG